MIHLVPAKLRLPECSPRLWLVFFGEADGMAWWARLCRPGFRHVAAASYFADQERWVYYDPGRRGTAIELYTGEEFDEKLGVLMQVSSAVLRVQSRFGRGCTPAGWHCVGAIKALLGVRSCALFAKGLHDHLLRIGAEPVEVPERVRPIRGREHAAATTGGSGGEAATRLGAAAG
jgi:hypothetical protein